MLKSRSKRCRCPDCHQYSHHIHSQYKCRIHDLPCFVSKTTGDVVWSKGFSVPGVQTEIAEDISFIGNDLVVQGSASGSGEAKQVFMVIDKNGVLMGRDSFSNQ